MSRIGKVFKPEYGRKALVSFVTAGDPSPAHTVPAMHALVAGGTDIIELGVPFSDPEAEGPTIQASSERALANGMTLSKVLEMVAEFRREDVDTPVVLMGYLNSVLAMPDFGQAAQQAGVDGLIMVNLPPEAADQLQADLAERGIDVIYLVAPTTTDDRARFIASKAAGFVYYVSLKGITGAYSLDPEDVAARLATLRGCTDLPICVGFGIKDAVAAGQVAQVADGVVVGSALVSLLAEHAEDVDAASGALQAAVADLRQGIDETV